MTHPKLQPIDASSSLKWTVHNPVTSSGRVPLWTIVSDDLTGLQAIAGEFARAGFLVGTGMSHLPGRRDLERFEVFGFDTATRHLEPHEAEGRVAGAGRHLLANGVTRIFKHNDSIMQGHVARELRALAEACGDRPIVYSPACPNRGRITVEGVQREVDANGELVKGGLDADLVASLASCGVETRRLDLASLRAGNAAQVLQGRGREVIVADAETDHDLDLLVEAAESAGCTVLAGSVGLAAALARRASPDRRSIGPILVIAGSLQRATRRQTERLRARADCVSVQLSLGSPIDGAIEEVRGALGKGLHCVVWSALDMAEDPDGASYPTLSREALEKLRRDLRTLIAGVMDDRQLLIGGLVVAGGSTADLALRDTLRVTRFSSLAWLCEGMTMAIATDGARPGLPVITKAGGWGPPEVLCTAIDQLTAWRCTQTQLERNPA